ncbi:MAG: helix-turn-helix domain-containing protein [Rudaea sp.]|uniref:helix-turn-helix transcriptional regulator n=1 Tax=Rudaea sp. TaxID=2136325 RepID=UPI0039E3259B
MKNPSATPLKPGDLIDAREAASILGIDPRTLANWRSQRKGPAARKIGARMVRYHRDDIAAFVIGSKVA